ncbi:hypothetical protein DXG03_003118 [Asterophora parasitica]|uniref:Uncharacterized protein n=1 Tax=Asterophora parasitica TaxID=117018 RepID=A0A9P7GK74_9AGAR|nr:hypothetical protein DXG03_003118 [Asterophora parasitica]
MALPPELLQQAYFLHVLATDPAKLIPPGKSLLSLMARAPEPPPPSALHARVEQAVHNAFWDEALQALSSPAPNVQLPRLKLLYSDLRDALQPLFPPDHTILLTLAAPLPPTSSPLHSTIALLQEILAALRKRCAPARDPDIDALLHHLASPPHPQHDQQENPLARLLVNTLRALITLADTLKRDLTDTLLGAMSEPQLTAVIRQQARARERELVQSPALWGQPDSDPVETLSTAWTEWVGGDDTVWTPRLLTALASPAPVTCHPHDDHPNPLPPQFFFLRPALLYLQNYAQALVVAAALKALVRLPPPLPGADAPDFVPRLWTLLKAEIDRDEYPIHFTYPDGTADAEDPSAHSTKLVNLADEVIRARRLFSSPVDEDQERELRSAVERTLQLSDPVFKLLQGRLVRAIGERVREMLKEGGEGGVRVPESMRTGRGAVAAALMNGAAAAPSNASVLPPIKGFEDEVLMRGIEEVVTNLVERVEWVESVWGDTIRSSEKPL